MLTNSRRLKKQLLPELCRFPVLFLLPNGRFSGFLYCTGFVGYLKPQRCPNNGHYGCRKVGFSTIARLMIKFQLFLGKLEDSKLKEFEDFGALKTPRICGFQRKIQKSPYSRPKAINLNLQKLIFGHISNFNFCYV